MLILLGAIGITGASAVVDEDYYLPQIRVGKLPRLRRGGGFSLPMAPCAENQGTDSRVDEILKRGR
jgi:hypothetical protein